MIATCAPTDKADDSGLRFTRNGSTTATGFEVSTSGGSVSRGNKPRTVPGHVRHTGSSTTGFNRCGSGNSLVSDSMSVVGAGPDLS